MHFAQCERVLRGRHWIARPRLHIIPPAVIRARKANNFLTTGLIARQTHGLHHRLGARHMKRNLVLPRNGTQASDIIEHARMIRAQDRAQIAHQLAPLFDTRLIKIQAEQVHTIRARHINQAIPIHVGQPDAITARPEATQLNVLLQHFTKLIGHPIVADELQVGDHRFASGCMRQGQRAARPQIIAQRGKRLTPLEHDLLRRPIGVKPFVVGVRVARHPPGNALRPTQVSTQRRVFSHRQLQTLLDAQQQPKTHGCCCSVLHNTQNLISHSFASKTPFYDFKVTK